MPGLIQVITVTVGEDEVDMDLTCEFEIEKEECQTREHPGSPGYTALLSAIDKDGVDQFKNLTARDIEWIQNKVVDGMEPDYPEYERDEEY
jgi:hypothetical protein